MYFSTKLYFHSTWPEIKDISSPLTIVSCMDRDWLLPEVTLGFLEKDLWPPEDSEEFNSEHMYLLFTGLGRSVMGKTVPEVSSTARDRGHSFSPYGPTKAGE